MAKMTTEQIKEHDNNPNVMLKINGVFFRCNCGCKVFHHPKEEDGSMDDNLFVCNLCNSEYEAKG